ncbi:MAG: sensor histidine kinase [Acetobacteraceae bacterium]|nr:sensor histidine kinase [Acetobacteraceae bacterium]
MAAFWSRATNLSGVRGRLLALMLVGAVPVAIVAMHNAVLERQEALDGLTRRVGVLREAVAARSLAALDSQRALVKGLAANGSWLLLPPGECDAALSAALTGEERFTGVWILDETGHLRCNSAGRPPGASFADQDYVGRVLATGSYAVGGFRRGPLTGQLVLQAAAPILRADGGIAGMVGAALRLDSLRAPPLEGAASHVWLFDMTGERIALDAGSEGRLPRPDDLDALRAGVADGILVAAARDGGLTAWAASPPGHPVQWLLALPAEDTFAAATRRFHRRLGEIGLFIFACILAILAGTELACSRPLRRLAGKVAAWRPGFAFTTTHSIWDPWEVTALNRALDEAARVIETRERQLSEALRQRDMMLAEVHHRVKNNLQIVASLLNLQAARIADGAIRAEFLLARERVQALATLHRHLHVEGDFAGVAIAPMLREMCAQMVTGAPAPGTARLEVDAAPLTLQTEHAVSVALLVAEAVTNALRHAFPAGGAGLIRVTLQVVAGEAVLEVADDGIGIAAAKAGTESVGMSLMRGFAAHLEGELSVETDGGTRVRLVFPVPELASPRAPSSVR